MSWRRAAELHEDEAWIVDNEPTRYHLDRCSSVRAADHGGVLDVVHTTELGGRVLCGLCSTVYGQTPPTPPPDDTPPPPAAQTPPPPPAERGGGG